MRRYLDCFVPIYRCNFKCHYCYISLLDHFHETQEKFPHPVEEMVRALSRERLGEDVFINLCAGGETLLLEESVQLVRGLLEEGHHVAVVTNGSLTKRFDEIATFPPELLERLFFKFSYHYLELRRMNLFDRYFANVKKMRDAGCSFTIELTPSDELIPYIDDAKQRCLDALGALPHNTVARDDRKTGIDILSKMDFDEYLKTWSTFDSELFRYKMHLYHGKVKSFCYAGDWSYYVNLGTGDLRPCNCRFSFGDIYEDVSKPLPRHAVGNYCDLPYCFNGHGWLSIGVNPDEKGPIYTELRNRVCADGSEWITKSYQDFWASPLYENHPPYTDAEKAAANFRRWRETHSVKGALRKAYHTLKRSPRK